MSDRVVKQVTLRAPLDRVWRALTDSTEFGRWFGAEFDGPFEPGRPATGRMRPTEVDPEVAAQQEPFRGRPWTAHIEAIEPMVRFSFRWNSDSESGVLTTVTFELEPVPEGVRLTLTESGFDALPAARRGSTRDENSAGWDHQTRLLAGFLEKNP